MYLREIFPTCKESDLVWRKHHRPHTYVVAGYTEEYNLLLYLAFVGYEKTFDSIKTWAVLQPVTPKCQLDYKYIEVLRYLYQNATMSVRLQNRSSNPIQIRGGVIQGIVIPPKLFTSALEDIFKLLYWKGFGINFNGEYLTHFRFADDIVFMAETLEHLNTILEDFSNAS